MFVPISWLREFVDIDLTPEQLAARLTLLGMEVRGMERRGDDWQSVVVGELLEVAPHPNADRLSLTRVRVDEAGTELSIVCGATNIAAGQRVPVALPGAVLPGDRRIERTAKMGVTSEGMLCSGDELGLTTDADGILILPEGSPIGRPLTELYGDVVLDIDVKPNRGDALSIVGLAREVAASTGASLRLPAIEILGSGDIASEHLSVTVEDARLCSRFVGRWIDGVAVGPSPLDIQLRLMAAGQRPVSNVVDASNYVMLELGKPVHVFDGAAVADGAIVVRSARAGERLETLDHVWRDLTPDTLLITDPRGPLAIAGVMGGASSEVGEGTTTVIVESAIFDPVSIRRTAARYALRSEASLRFEKGLDHAVALTAAHRTAQLVAAWAGGRVAQGVVDSDPAERPLRRVPFRTSRVDRILGVSVAADEQRSLLARVGVETEPAGPGTAVAIADGVEVVADGGSEALVAIIPGHRRDLAIEADIVEEIARIRGYETIPPALPSTQMPSYRPDPRRSIDRARDLLSGQGLSEVMTHGLIGVADHERLGFDERRPSDHPHRQPGRPRSRAVATVAAARPAHGPRRQRAPAACRRRDLRGRQRPSLRRRRAHRDGHARHPPRRRLGPACVGPAGTDGRDGRRRRTGRVAGGAARGRPPGARGERAMGSRRAPWPGRGAASGRRRPGHRSRRRARPAVCGGCRRARRARRIRPPGARCPGRCHADRAAPGPHPTGRRRGARCRGHRRR